MRKHPLFVLYNLYKASNSWTNLKEKPLKSDFSFKQNIKQAVRPNLRGKYYADACITLNARTTPVAFAPGIVLHVVFFISLILVQSSENGIRNTEHSDIDINDECNSK